MCMEYTFAFSVRRSCLIQEYVGNVHCVHLKLYIHRCSYKDKEDPTQPCAYGTDELGNAQSHMAREHDYDSHSHVPKVQEGDVQQKSFG